MIKTEVYKHDDFKALNNHIENKIKDGYKLISCSTKDIFRTFSLYLKESTIVYSKN